MRNLLRAFNSLTLCLGLVLAFTRCALADEDDPPSRAARLGFVQGAVSFQPAGTDDWVSAVLNRPIITGDKLWTDKNSRAELQIGSATIRLGDETGFSFLSLTDEVTQIRFTAGVISIHLRHLDPNETAEVDTPNLAFSLLRPGDYRLEVNEVGDSTVVSVRSGEGEVTGGGQVFSVHANQRAIFIGTDQLASNIGRLGGYDDFDRWCRDRDHHQEHSPSARYVSRDVVGYQDLDEYGEWRRVPDYGPMWVPRTMSVGWAPYRYGHWVWISPWGWTWVDDAPWGFAPFHYGRWAYIRGVWGWCPGPVVVARPVYAPALVAWVGGPRFSISIGMGPGVGWFPLAPREVYVPPYQVSRNYVTNVNVTNTTVNNTYVTNVYNNYTTNNPNVSNVKYLNQRVPGAVTVTSQRTFVSAQPVQRNIVKLDERQLTQARVDTHVGVGPQQKSVLGAAGPSVRPPSTVQSRTVVARTTPPPAPVDFARQQQAIQSNGGRPLTRQDERRLELQGLPSATPVVRRAVRPVSVETAARVKSNPTEQHNEPMAAVSPRDRGQGSPTHQSQPNRPQNPQARDDRPPSVQPYRTPSPSNPSEIRSGNSSPIRTDRSLQNTRDFDSERRHQVDQQRLQQQQEQQLQSLEQKHQQQMQKTEQRTESPHQQQEHQKLQQKQEREVQKLEYKQQQREKTHQ